MRRVPMRRVLMRRLLMRRLLMRRLLMRRVLMRRVLMRRLLSRPLSGVARRAGAARQGSVATPPRWLAAAGSAGMAKTRSTRQEGTASPRPSTRKAASRSATGTVPRQLASPESGSPATTSRATASPEPGKTESPSNRWTFLTNHSHVLVLLDSEEAPVLREVALQVGITERAMQRIIQDLEEGGFIERERIGRRNRYRVMKDQTLRHPIESHRTIGELLELIAPQH